MRKGMQCLSVVLVVGMFAVAGFFDEKALVFPEIAALACGAWAMEKPPWRFNALSVCVSPTLAALTGVLMLRYLPGVPVLLITGAFIVVALQLRLLKSAVIPSLSAAILPILTKVDSLWYPASVGVCTAIIALVHLLRVRLAPEDTAEQGASMVPSPETCSGDLKQWTTLTFGVFLVTLAAFQLQQYFMVAPPLIVTFVEVSKPGSPLRKRMPQVLFLLAFSAFTGVLLLHLIHFVFHLPIWVSAGGTFGTVYLLYHSLRMPFPPAAAIALLPTIIPSAELWAYPRHVVLGTLTFLLLSVILFRREEGVVVAEAEVSGTPAGEF